MGPERLSYLPSVPQLVLDLVFFCTTLKASPNAFYPKHIHSGPGVSCKSAAFRGAALSLEKVEGRVFGEENDSSEMTFIAF